MACRSALRSVFLTTDPRGPAHRTFVPSSRNPLRRTPSTARLQPIYRAPNFHLRRPVHRVSCLENDSASVEQGPPQEAILKAIAEVSKAEGRVGHTTNVVIGGTVTHDATSEWLQLDQKVNLYPTVRGFTAIGTGGDDFVQSMVVPVESVIQQPVPEVQAVYNAMRRDDRMKYFL